MDELSSTFIKHLDLLYYFIVAVVFVEAIIITYLSSYDWKALVLSFADMYVRKGFIILVPFSIFGPLGLFLETHRLTNISSPTWENILVLFLGFEFCYYWSHRASHKIRWFWCTHVVHHSPSQLFFSAAMRTGLFGKLTGIMLFYLPLTWVGFSSKSILAVHIFNLTYQIFIHSSWIPKLGWLEYVFSTPSNHRVHHARNPEYLNANYGGVLIIFDRLFGTFIEEREDLACEYGVVGQEPTYNFFKMEFREWSLLFRDLIRARSLSAVLGYLVMPPGWTPEPIQCATNSAKTEKSEQRKVS